MLRSKESITLKFDKKIRKTFMEKCAKNVQISRPSFNFGR